jgi:fatty-acid peroxygenase
MKLKDDTLALLKNPYRFISSKSKNLGKDVFETRILMQKTYCMTGKEAAALFYDPEYFVRAGASPEALRATLFGKGGVQGLDGFDHAERKLMFMSLMTEENAAELKHLFLSNMRHSLKHWSLKDSIILYDELQKILTETVCAWAGIRMEDEDLLRRTKEIVSLFDSAGATGPAHFLSRISRKNAEDWIENIVMDLRSDGFEPLIKTPIEIIIWYKDSYDELLKPRTAAVEILNIIRPAVAISVYMVFIAHALHSNPDVYEKLIAGDDDYADKFIQEVRRYYPFFPSIMAKVKQDFTWRNMHFKKGARAILDLYGVNNDSRLWDDPHIFWPERFDFAKPDEFSFIPQGGGNPFTGHRCPGELFTLELMKTALNFFLYEMDYDVPKQNINIDWSRLPAIPESRFILSNIRPKEIFVSKSFTTIELSSFS